MFQECSNPWISRCDGYWFIFFKVIVCLLKPNTQTQSYSSPETRIGLSLASGIGMDFGGKFVGNEDVIISSNRYLPLPDLRNLQSWSGNYISYTHLDWTFNGINSQVSFCVSNKCGKQQLDNAKTKRKPQPCFIIMDMISQVHMTDQVMLPLPRHSFVALGLPRKAQCPCSGKRRFTSLQTAHVHTQPQPGMKNTTCQLHHTVARHSHKWVRVLPTKIIAKPQEWQLHAQMTCHTMQCPGTVTPASQLCNKASSHCGTKPNNNQTNVTKLESLCVETCVQGCRDRLQGPSISGSNLGRLFIVS